MALRFEQYRDSLTEAADVVKAFAVERDRLNSADRYSEEYKLKLIADARDKATQRVEQILDFVQRSIDADLKITRTRATASVTSDFAEMSYYAQIAPRAAEGRTPVELCDHIDAVGKGGAMVHYRELVKAHDLLLTREQPSRWETVKASHLTAAEKDLAATEPAAQVYTNSVNTLTKAIYAPALAAVNVRLLDQLPAMIDRMEANAENAGKAPQAVGRVE